MAAKLCPEQCKSGIFHSLLLQISCRESIMYTTFSIIPKNLKHYLILGAEPAKNASVILTSTIHPNVLPKVLETQLPQQITNLSAFPKALTSTLGPKGKT